MRDDEAFGSFRSELYTTYSSLPKSARQEEFDNAMREAEEAVLAPKISEARRSVCEGPLSGVLRVLKYPLRIAFSIAVAAARPEDLVTQGWHSPGSPRRPLSTVRLAGLRGVKRFGLDSIATVKT